MPPLTISIWAHLDARARDLIRTSLAGDRVHFVNAQGITPADIEALRDTEVIFGNAPASRIENCGRLRWLQLESIGFEYYEAIAGRVNGLAVSNLKGLFDRPAVETALAGLLALNRGLQYLIPAQAEARWIELEVRPLTRLFHGRRALVLGLGSIGQRMRRVLEVFDCHVSTFARTNAEAHWHTAAELAKAFPDIDLVVCCLPKTPQTVGLISRQLLELLPKEAVFVNIGRGAVVDEQALIERLQQRRLAGAVIDVTLEEPLPPDHPWWRCPNTLLTQHTGGGYDDELTDKARFFLANLERFRKGDPLLNLIDLKRGY